MFSRSSRQRSLFAFVLLALVLPLAGVWTARSAPPAAPPPGLSQQLNSVPIFRLVAPTVNESTAAILARGLSGIGGNQPIVEDQYLGQPRFTVANTTTLSLLSQFGASGGFYATDLRELGRDEQRGPLDPLQAEWLACQALTGNNGSGLINGDGSLPSSGQSNTPLTTSFNPQFCDFNPGSGFARVRSIQSSSVPVGAGGQLGATTTISVGLVVEIPMSIRFGRAQLLPVGGPGGHISLLFSTTADDKQASLSPFVPGLAALAMPVYGRSLEVRGEVERRSLDELKALALEQVRATYGQDVVVRGLDQVEEFYYFDDAAVQQTLVEPVASFAGVEVDLPTGETVILRDIVIPVAASGPNGLGPTVSITAPSNNSGYQPGSEVTLRGLIEDGTAPYSFSWLLGDERELGAGELPSAGPIELATRLPVLERGGIPLDQTVILRVTDADGVQRETAVSLRPTVVPLLYLPAVSRNASATIPAGNQAVPNAELAQASFTFGVVGVWDYPPVGAGGSDLPGVIPDVNGFRSGMSSIGYSSRFYWTNSAAWEKDWRDCALGGIDCTSGVDRADFVYYAGHGGAGGLHLASNRDSSWADASNARFNSLRWVGFASCQTLRVQGFTPGNEPIRRWFNSFRGSHMLLGFNSNMRDVAFGGRLVDNMRLPSFFGIEFPTLQQTIAQAWVNTAFQLNAGKPAYIYAQSATVNPINNKLPKPGTSMPARPLPVTSYHWVWWNE
ncbi:MAG: DUF6345 domain-containing protein [Oscillochloridaceae bacterium umkhey_bin13]